MPSVHLSRDSAAPPVSLKIDHDVGLQDLTLIGLIGCSFNLKVSEQDVVLMGRNRMQVRQ
ncbi:MAG: hypothetical protein LZF86_110158 [Nitrospira sp.]|nr:MAG: hypothetical protein LZF86_110158 [Nitrospira sp.]